MFSHLDPSEYLTLASELASESGEAAKRTAVDRAYYAAFLTSRDILAAKNLITPYYNADDHKYVATSLKRYLGTFGNEENRLRLARNLSTYDTRSLDIGHGARPVEWMIDTASTIIDKVKALPDHAGEH